MRDIPIRAEVRCTDGLCGETTYLIIDPVQQHVTHVVVRDKRSPHTEWLVPIQAVEDSSPQELRLRLSKAEFEKLDPFIDKEYVRAKEPYREIQAESLRYLPYVRPSDARLQREYVTIEHVHVPEGERAVTRGARVEARDGRVGQVGEFVVNPQSGKMTHMVLESGHLWGHRDVCIPFSHVERIDDETLYLDLDKKAIEALPKIKLHRGQGSQDGGCDG